MVGSLLSTLTPQGSGRFRASNWYVVDAESPASNDYRTHYLEPIQKTLGLSDLMLHKAPEAVVNHFVINMFLIRVDYNVTLTADFAISTRLFATYCTCKAIRSVALSTTRSFWQG
jgi:hypothetical protein